MDMDDLKKMTKAQLIAEILRVREAAHNAPCGCCGTSPKEWEEAPLLDPIEPEPNFDVEPVFVPTCWAAQPDVEEPDDWEDE
jgi:hypothetical protein